ncbi:hypothetical protein R5W24_003527 [Gemmata sp. JC717]|uniref:hypothetical protein n=1 Tax=Gemmata algarum TaxID=2975278 RepID=UPI0021BA8549|nr:hypothetical protein [Gemmata algarum]MDY3554405.1 hypothetical protein [Gemmata algarum]
MDDALIREVEPGEAEAVLTLRLFMPGIAGGIEEQHYLSRRPPRSHTVVESVAVRPDGRVTERSTITVTERVQVVHCSHADGRGCGYGKVVSIDGRPGGGAAVRVSMHWTGAAGGRGDLDEELAVPWLGYAKRELGGGAWMAAEITAVGSSAEPGAATHAAG